MEVTALCPRPQHALMRLAAGVFFLAHLKVGDLLRAGHLTHTSYSPVFPCSINNLFAVPVYLHRQHLGKTRASNCNKKRLTSRAYRGRSAVTFLVSLSNSISTNFVQRLWKRKLVRPSPTILVCFLPCQMSFEKIITKMLAFHSHENPVHLDSLGELTVMKLPRGPQVGIPW